jgi:hypothetical protein
LLYDLIFLLFVHFLLLRQISCISAQTVNCMERYIIALRLSFLRFYIFLLFLARQRETENVIMLRAKRETASQELEALVRQHKLVLRIRLHRIHMFLGLLDPDPLVRGMATDPSITKQK